MKKSTRIGTAASSPQRWQRNGLAAASLMALASVALGQQASMSITFGGGTVSTTTFSATGAPWSYSNAFGNPQDASSAVASTPTTLTMGQNYTAGTGSASPSSITEQVIQSLTRVNVLTPLAVTGRIIDLSLINTGDTNLAYALQSASGDPTGGSSPNYTIGSQSVTSSVTDGLIRLTQIGYASSVRSLDSNQINAIATSNTAQLVAAGQGAGTYTSTQIGSASASYGSTGPASSDVRASVGLNAVQGVLNNQSLSIAQGAQINLTVSESSASNLTDALSASSNTINASTVGNSTNSLFQSSSSSGAWNGSVVATTVQSAARTTGDTTQMLATVSDGSMSANVRDTAANTTTLATSLTQSSNTIVAQVAANSAGVRSATGAVSTAGNAIQFDSGAAVTGTSSTTSSTISSATASSLGADLGVLNAQAARNLSLTAAAEAGAGALQIRAQADQITATGSVVQNDNTISARAVPNLAGNLVSIGQTTQATSLTGSVAVVNAQRTSGNTKSEAYVDTGLISLEAGLSNTSPNAGVATSSNNTISALADANLVANTTLINAANLAVGGNLSGTTGVTSSMTGASLSSGVGVLSLNQQNSVESQIESANDSSAIKLSSISGADLINTSGLNAAMSGNTLSASSSANTSFTSIGVTGTTALAFSAALGNQQSTTVIASKTLSAAAGGTSPLSMVLQTGDAASSQLASTSNAIESTAAANRAVNSLSTNLGSQMSGNTTWLAAPSVSVDLDGMTATTQADISLVNNQFIDGPGTTNAAKLQAITVGAIELNAGVVSGTGNTLNLSSNRISATMAMNQATNSVTPDAVTATTVSAGLASSQVAQQARGDASTSGSSISTTTTSLAATNATVNENTVRATANINSVANTLNSTVTSASGRTGVGMTATTGLTASTLDSVADLSLVNNQTIDTVRLVADQTTSASSIAINVATGAVSAASNLTVNQNSVLAVAEGNAATNRLIQSSGVLASTTTGLASRQDIVGASSSITASANDQINVLTTTVGGASNIQLSSNQIGSSALGNYATNAVTLSGATLNRASPATLSVSSTDGTVTADNALVNLQSGLNQVVDADTIGIVSMTVGAVSGASNLTSNANQLSANAQLNYASNAQSLTYSTNVAGATQGQLSLQTASASTASASLATSSAQQLTAGTVAGGTVQQNQNISESSAGLNTAFNRITQGGGVMTGTSSALTNSQATDSSSAVTADTDAMIKTITSTVSGAANLQLSSNEINARTLGNYAVNAFSASGTNLVHSSPTTLSVNIALGTQAADNALVNLQSADTLTQQATTLGEISLTTGAVSGGSNLTSNSNQLSASAQINYANNTQSLNYSTGVTGATQGLLSSQSVTDSSAAASLGSGTQSLQQLSAGAISGGSVQLNLNTAEASAGLNSAINGITQSGGAMVSTPTALTNSQSNSASTVTASVDHATKILTSAAVSGAASIQLNSNQISASGLGNYGVNSLTASGTTLTHSAPTALSVNIGAGTVAADNGLVNLQSVDLLNLQANTLGETSMTLGAVSGASNLTMNSNQLSASAQLNYATNTQSLSYGTSITGATQGLLSRQTVADSSATATLGNGTQALQQLGAASISGGVLQFNLNSAEAASALNAATNRISYSTGTSTGASSAVVNSQSVVNTTEVVTASLNSASKVTISGDVDTSASLGMNNNSQRSQALANIATNGVSISGTSVSSALASTGVTSAVGESSTALQRVINAQETEGTSVTATSDSTIKMLITGDVTSSSLAFKGNTSTALAQVNTATNSQNLALSAGLSATPLAIGSTQTTSIGTTLSATNTSILNVTVDTGTTLDNSQLDMSGNQASATTAVNQVTNSILVSGASSNTGTNITGKNLITSLSVNLGTPAATATSDASVVSYQKNSARNSTATLTTDIGFTAATVDGSTSTTQLSLANNSATAAAQSNVANNTVNLVGSTVSNMTGAIVNAQDTVADVTSTLNASAGVLHMTLGDVTGSNLVMSGNTLLSLASMNDATNYFRATAASLSGQGTAVTSISDVSTATLTRRDFSLLNVQSGQASAAGVSASLDPGQSVFSSASVGGSTLTMRNNNMTAQAMVNNANNDLTLQTTADLLASAAVKNIQTSTSGASALLGTAVGTSNVGMSTDTVSSTSTFNMEGNVFRAQAGANNATNVLNANSGTSVAPSNGLSSAPLNFAIQNYQSAEGGVISATVQNLNLGPTVTTGGSALNVAMTANQVVALAYGNLVSNTIGMKPLAQGMETGGSSVYSVQRSTASLSASVSNVNMSISGAGMGAGSVAMSGNSITSQVVANQASVGMVAR